MKIYAVERRDWDSNDILKIFSNEKKARDYADFLERTKEFSDGYNLFYVKTYTLED